MIFRPTLRFYLAAWSAIVSGIVGLSVCLLIAYTSYWSEIRLRDRVVAARGEMALEYAIASPDPLKAPSALFADLPKLAGFASGRDDATPVVVPWALRARLPDWPPASGFYDAPQEPLPNVRLAVFRRSGMAVLVAYGIVDEKNALKNRLLLLWSAPLFGLFGGLGAWVIAGRSLRPVAKLSQAAERITAGNLNERLTVPAGADEIARLAEVLDRMLARLSASFAQAARFSADASHELRTPLTIMRCTLEDALHSGDCTEKQERTLLGLLDEVAALTGVTQDLLLLSRFDANAMPLRRERIDLSAMLAELADDASMLAEPRLIEIVTDGIVAGGAVDADRALLRRLLLIMLDNAVRHNRDGGRVCVRLGRDGARMRVTVTNTGEPISESDKAQLFTRFFRSASDRGRDSGGSGLGLSLGREIARAHGGDLRLVSSSVEATVFVAELPAAD